MPIMFFGHGSPMNALATNRYTDTWSAMGRAVAAAEPKAVLMVSAHWFINATAVTAMASPRTIHDFYGFPEELFAVEYTAPGAPDVAQEIVETAEPAWIGLDLDSWGLDHGTWSVLRHALPDADVPVIQLAIDSTKPLGDHVELGAILAPLLERGVMIAGSGNVVHNLGRVDWASPEGGYDWAHRFDEEARRLMTEAPGDVGRLGEHPDFAQAVPTPDHLIPALYVAGAAAAAGTTLSIPVEGYALGSLSMTCYSSVSVPA